MNKVTENLILDIDDIRNLFGNLDSNIDYISKKFDVSIKNSDDALSRFVSPIVESVYSAEGLENRLHDVVGYMDERLKRGLNWLSMMVTMAPLLGLLGTVVGMIRSFAAVGGDIGAPTVITGGVSEALVATATGLSVAIVALAIHSWCTDKVNSDIAKLEQKLGSIMDLYIRSQR